MDKFVDSCVQKSQTALEFLSRFNHLQSESIILSRCDPTVRLQHLLRFSLANSVASRSFAADSVTVRHIERIVGRPLPEGSASNASGPIESGELGNTLLCHLDQRDMSRKTNNLQ